MQYRRLLLFFTIITLFSKINYAAYPVQRDERPTVTINGDDTTGIHAIAHKGTNRFGISSIILSSLAFPIYTIGSATFSLGRPERSSYHHLALIMAVAGLIAGVIGINKRLKGLAIAGILLSFLSIIPYILF